MKSLKNKKVLITGNNGYIGSQLVSFLSGQSFFDLLTIDKEPADSSNHHCFDLSDKERLFRVMDEWEPDLFIHCATHSALAYYHHFVSSFRNDAAVLFHLLEALQKRSTCRLIYFSSSYVYSGLSMEQPVAEEAALKPEHPFGIAKNFFEQFILKNHPNSVVFRLTSIFGAGRCLFPNAVHKMIEECIQQKELVIWGEGKRKMQYIYMPDVLRCIAEGFHLQPGIYNMGGDEYVSIAETAGQIAKHFQVPARFLKEKKEGETLPFASTDKLKRESGKIAFTPFAQGLQQYMESL